MSDSLLTLAERVDPATRQALRESIDLENRADMHAYAGQFRPASDLMKQANAIRSQVFGKGLAPNDLRERTYDALA